MTLDQHRQRIQIVAQSREGRRTPHGYKILTIIVLSNGAKFQGTNKEAEQFLKDQGVTS